MEVYDHQVLTCYEMGKFFRAYLCFFSTLRKRVILYNLWHECRLQDTFISGELAVSLICIFTLFPLSPRAFHLLSKTASNETLSSIISYVYRLAHVHSMFDSPDIGDTCLQPT